MIHELDLTGPEYTALKLTLEERLIELPGCSAQGTMIRAVQAKLYAAHQKALRQSYSETSPRSWGANPDDPNEDNYPPF